MKKEKPPIVILLSGGMDSFLALSLALENNPGCYPLSINYNQHHYEEIHWAEQQAAFYGLTLFKMAVDNLQGSLTAGEVLPDVETTQLASSFTPARNAVFLSLAANYAASITDGPLTIGLGVNVDDFQGFPDCRHTFLNNMEIALSTGMNRQVQFFTPLLSYSKGEIIKTCNDRSLPLGLTRSCYNLENGLSCGTCLACKIRLKAFTQRGLKDPVPYKQDLDRELTKATPCDIPVPDGATPILNGPSHCPTLEEGDEPLQESSN